MNTTNKNVNTEKTEYVDGMKYTSECGVEFIYDPAGNNEKPFVLSNGIRIDHKPTTKDKSLLSLKPFNQCTREEAQRIQSAGGIQTKINRERKKTAQETIRMLLSLPATKSELKEFVEPAILSSLTEEEKKQLDQQFLIYARALELAKAGSKDHLVILRDTAGDKPTDKVQSEVNIMTDSDRALMDKLSKRLNKEQDS